jgi:molybdenum cofactor cytidylyltransferase
VIGAHAQSVAAALAGLDVQIVENLNWVAGQSTSLAAGIHRLPEAAGAVVFLLADQPQAPATLVRSLVARHAETLAPIIAPLIDGQRGNPVLFDRQTFSDLLTLQGDIGGRALFSQYPVNWLPWHDASLLLDIDRPQDYRQLSNLQQAASSPDQSGESGRSS